MLDTASRLTQRLSDTAVPDAGRPAAEGAVQQAAGSGAMTSAGEAVLDSTAASASGLGGLGALPVLLSTNATVILVILGILVVLFFAAAIRIVKEYERGVIFRLGRLVGAKGPGLFLLIPVLDKMVKVDLRTITHDVPVQEIITFDNVPVRVNAVVYFRVVDPESAVVEVEHFGIATSQIAQTTLRAVIGKAELDELLAQRDTLNQQLQQIIDAATDPWGVKVGMVEIKDVELPQDMRRAMARQAEAERERRARVITAEGEFQAAQKLAEASKVLATEQGGMFMRMLQTLQEAGDQKGTKVVLPLPIEMLKAMGYHHKDD